MTAYAGEVDVVDPRPLLGEPLPLDLLNTTWRSGDAHAGPTVDEAGARIFLDGHGFDAPADAAARRALRETREALRALLLSRADTPPPGSARTALAARRSRPSTPCSLAADSDPCSAGGLELEVVAANHLARAVDLCRRVRRVARTARRPHPRLREPRLHPLVPRHDAARHAPLVLDGGVREPRQGNPARSRAPALSGDWTRPPRMRSPSRRGPRARVNTYPC